MSRYSTSYSGHSSELMTQRPWWLSIDAQFQQKQEEADRLRQEELKREEEKRKEKEEIDRIIQEKLQQQKQIEEQKRKEHEEFIKKFEKTELKTAPTQNNNTTQKPSVEKPVSNSINNNSTKPTTTLEKPSKPAQQEITNNSTSNNLKPTQNEPVNSTEKPVTKPSTTTQPTAKPPAEPAPTAPAAAATPAAAPAPVAQPAAPTAAAPAATGAASPEFVPTVVSTMAVAGSLITANPTVPPVVSVVTPNQPIRDKRSPPVKRPLSPDDDDDSDKENANPQKKTLNEMTFDEFKKTHDALFKPQQFITESTTKSPWDEAVAIWNGDKELDATIDGESVKVRTEPKDYKEILRYTKSRADAAYKRYQKAILKNNIKEAKNHPGMHYVNKNGFFQLESIEETMRYTRPYIEMAQWRDALQYFRESQHYITEFLNRSQPQIVPLTNPTLHQETSAGSIPDTNTSPLPTDIGQQENVIEQTPLAIEIDQEFGAMDPSLAGSGNPSDQTSAAFFIGKNEPKILDDGNTIIFSGSRLHYTWATRFDSVDNPLATDVCRGTMNCGKFKFKPLGYELPWDYIPFYCTAAEWEMCIDWTKKSWIDHVEVELTPMHKSVYFSTGSTTTQAVTNEYGPYLYKSVGFNHKYQHLYARLNCKPTAMSVTKSDFKLVDYADYASRCWGDRQRNAADRPGCDGEERELQIVGGILLDASNTTDSTDSDYGVYTAWSETKRTIPFQACINKPFIREKYSPKVGLIHDPTEIVSIYKEGYTAAKVDANAVGVKAIHDPYLKGAALQMRRCDGTLANINSGSQDNPDNNRLYNSTDPYELGTSRDWDFGVQGADPNKFKISYKNKITAQYSKALNSNAYGQMPLGGLAKYNSKIERAGHFVSTGADNDTYNSSTNTQPSIIFGMAPIRQMDLNQPANNFLKATITWCVTYKMVIKQQYIKPEIRFSQRRTYSGKNPIPFKSRYDVTPPSHGYLIYREHSLSKNIGKENASVTTRNQVLPHVNQTDFQFNGVPLGARPAYQNPLPDYASGIAVLANSDANADEKLYNASA